MATKEKYFMPKVALILQIRLSRTSFSKHFFFNSAIKQDNFDFS